MSVILQSIHSVVCLNLKGNVASNSITGNGIRLWVNLGPKSVLFN